MADITKSVKFLLLGEDKTASKSLKGVGDQSDKTHGKLDGLKKGAKIAGAAIGAGLLVAGAAALDFGKDSLAAFAEADKAQKQLEDAYKRFPAIASVNIDALRKYNEAIQRKTGADADDIASGQSVLARYKLTGEQLKSMTPLLVDYAERTGKSIPDAAKSLGKALGGSSKAAKELGFDFKASKDPAANYEQIMRGLKGTVGGYAESLPEAEKKQKILQASFGDLQEAVGEKLQPVMIGLIDAGQGVMDWLEENPEVTEGASAAFDLLGQVLSGLWDIVTTYVAPALGFLIKSQASVARSAGDMLAALGNVPGFEWAKDASVKVYGIADSMDKVGDGIAALANRPKPVIGVTNYATPEVEKIQAKIKSLEGKVVQAKADGDTKEVDKLQKKIDDLKDKTVTLTTRTIVRKAQQDGGSTAGKNSKAKRATGGWAGAGQVWAGEYGTELLTLSRPMYFTTAAESARMGSGGGVAVTGGTIVQVLVQVAPTADTTAVGRAIRDALLDLKGALGGRDLGIA